MSLLGAPEPVRGWLPAEALREPPCDASHITTLVEVAADLVHHTGRLHAQGCALADVLHHLRRRLEEGRVEAALVRRALGLLPDATTEETVCRARALQQLHTVE